jgi:hypothetical protein
MKLTQSNGFAPFVGPQHYRRQDHDLSTMVTQRNGNFNPYMSGVINSSSNQSSNNGNGSDRKSGTYNRNYDRADSTLTETRYDRYLYQESETTYGNKLNATRFNDGGSVRVPTGQHPESGSSSSFAELSNPIKRQRLEISPQAVKPVQITGLSPSNLPSHRTREEIEALAYSQGAKKGG